MSWQWLSLLALLSFSLSFLGMKRLSMDSVPSSAILFWITGIGGALYLGQALLKGDSLKAGGLRLALLLGVGALCFVGNLAQVEAISKAPNPGYALSIVMCSAALTGILSMPLFGSAMSGMNMLGLAFCLVGTILVSMS